MSGEKRLLLKFLYVRYVEKRLLGKKLQVDVLFVGHLKNIL